MDVRHRQLAVSKSFSHNGVTHIIKSMLWILLKTSPKYVQYVRSCRPTDSKPIRPTIANNRSPQRDRNRFLPRSASGAFWRAFRLHADSSVRSSHRLSADGSSRRRSHAVLGGTECVWVGEGEGGGVIEGCPDACPTFRCAHAKRAAMADVGSEGFWIGCCCCCYLGCVSALHNTRLLDASIA